MKQISQKIFQIIFAMHCSVSDKNITSKEIISFIQKYMVQRNFIEVLRNKNSFINCVCHKIGFCTI